MKKIITIAAALLVLQIGLVAALQFTGSGPDQKAPSSPLLEFATDAVTMVTITGPEKEQLVLEKKDGTWILPASFGAPANAEQVTGLLTKLSGFKQGLAVGTTEAAAKRFKVVDDAFQRHVVMKAGDEVVGDLYVGTSPGFRQIHVRKAGSENVVVVELSTFELEPKADQWLDKNLFKIKEGEIEAISFADFTLKKQEKDWQVQDLQEGQASDAQAAADLVAKAIGLTIQAVVEPKEAEALFAGTTPALQYSITRKGGATVDFRLIKAEGDSYLLKQSERDLYCTVHNLQVEGLLKVNRAALLAKPQPAEAEKPADGDAAAAADGGGEMENGGN